ncbi:hypothetical protein E4U54_008020 [Claviceps lovelessii]|nr:hypothetical protein E4U54_008020 [Claviceps lovelessii]
MYARYVPPSKGVKAPEVAQSPSAAAAAAMPDSNPSRSANSVDAVRPKLVEEFSYTRYVPASKSRARGNTITEAAPGPKPIQFFDDEPVSGTPKRKRESPDGPQSSSKKLRKGNAEFLETSGIANGAVPSLNERSGEKKKKNRRKRKQRTQAAADDSDNDSDDNSDDSHAPAQTPSKPPRDKQKKKQTPVVQEEDVAMDGLDDQDDQDDHVVDNNQHVNGDVAMNEVTMIDTQPKSESPEKEKKPKREKKKKSVKESAPGQEEEKGDEVDDKVLARHKAVLERKTKSIKLANEVVQDEATVSDEESAKTYALEPLPQPAVVPDDESKPAYDTLPPWLAAPIRAAQDTRKPFTELGISQRPSRILAEKGYSEAFAVQTAAIPLLLPTSTQRVGDVLVSAATGSGKTLAYALPIVRDISQGVVSRLRALVVLPTRELVKQAQDVFEMCAKAYEGEDRKRVRIGVAIGSQSIKSEQEALVESDSRYDPDTYQAIQEEHKQRQASGPTSADVHDQSGLHHSAVKDPRLGTWEGEVVDFTSKVDILICTPGRLVEHIEQTPGFNLDFVRWLVVDEADKLLSQSFQGWLELVLDKFQTKKFSARDFPDMAYSGVRKVILSATLTRDLSLLNQLALRRPQLIVLENDASVQVAEHTLPMTLQEHAVRVHEANLKPLYLLDLLRGAYMKKTGTATEGGSSLKVAEEDKHGQSDSTSEDSSSEGSESSSDDSSDTSSDDSSDTSSADSDDSSDNDSPAKARSTTPKSQLPIALIFTKSNESALRLSRLLTLLDASLDTQIKTLTSTTATHIRRKILRAFTTAASPIRLIIASDLVARGIDIPKLEHVVNYDLPASVAGYVHRVGRTARAGRQGSAWTLISDDESGWFWGKIAKNPGVKRAQKVQRTRIEEMSEESIKEYEGALAKLGQEALELRRNK